MAAISAVDELYSVSDLHIGGEPGAQIFCQGRLLGALIDHLRARPKDRRVALVLNGDVVDFLAETGGPDERYLKPQSAVTILGRIFKDPGFKPVWEALGRYVKTDNRLLVLGLGNHDVELALPDSQERILKELCGKDGKARANIVWCMEGQPFRAAVGPAQVLCTHGNEVDPWNPVDHDQLRRVQEAQRQGTQPPAWDPNAGTQLVIDIMNDVKRRFPFVDLLKPETEVVPSMILALDPQSLGALHRFTGVAYRRMRGSSIFRRLSGWLGQARSALGGGAAQGGMLGGPAAGPSEEEEYVRRTVLGSRARQIGAPLTEDQVLGQMEKDFRAGLRPLEVLALESGSGAEDGMLGLGQYVYDRLVRDRSPQQALREAILDWLKDGATAKTYDFFSTDDTFSLLDESVDPDVDFLLAGHTHLARALRRTRGKGYYFNSGTWIRLIRLDQRVLASDSAFGPAYQALTAGTMAAIDAAGDDLVYQRPTVVRVLAEDGRASGELTLARLDDDGQFVLQPEQKTRFSVPRS